MAELLPSRGSRPTGGTVTTSSDSESGLAWEMLIVVYYAYKMHRADDVDEA